MTQNVPSCRGFSFRPTFCFDPPPGKILLVRFLDSKQGIVPTSHVFELQKILLAQMNVHDSRNPMICDQKLPMAWRTFVRKIALAPVLLYKLALYESCVGASATPQGNEIRVSEENSLKMIASDLTSVNISWNFRFSKFFGSMEPPLGAPQLLRCKFVLRFGATNRKP